MFNELDAQSPFDRGARNGFRLVKDLDEAEVPATVKGPLPDIHTRDYAKEKPVADAIFEVYRSLYAYDRTELKASIEAVEDSSDRFRREKVGFAATYGNERMFAYLYTPKNVRPPWQVVLFFPARRSPGCAPSRSCRRRICSRSSSRTAARVRCRSSRAP